MQPNQSKFQITRERFYNRFFENDNGCWIWIGAKQHSYGKMRFMMKDVRAHRASWMIHFGEIPEGMSVLHRCDTPLCVNPNHLFLGTQQENMADKVAKGRIGNTALHNRIKTHCPQGHELSGDNLYTHKNGRYCRACRSIQNRKYKEKTK